MDIKLNHKIIKDMCGTVSFKRGDAFYRANKVIFHEEQAEFVAATVQGAEDFYVKIEIDEKENIDTSCSCSALLNFSKPCQHVAAVLIALYEQNRQGMAFYGNDHLHLETGDFTGDFLALFQNKPARTSGHQLHFEKREVLDVHFRLSPFSLGQDQYLFGIEVKINQTPIPNIRGFLQDVRAGKASKLSPAFTYDPSLHCFMNESDTVLHQLVRVARDEAAFLEVLPIKSKNVPPLRTLLIPPSAWASLYPLLGKAPLVTLEQEGQVFSGLNIVEGPPPIQFQLEESEPSQYQLKITGLERLILMDGYRSVLWKGKLFQLKDDFARLTGLIELLAKSGTEHLPIPEKQLDLFLKKIVPGLKRIGEVRLSKPLMERMMKTPLVAKLYLDRVRNRLLAGLEFHYEHVVIQPLESRENITGPYVVRNIKREDEILGLMETSGFTKTEGGYFMQNEELEYDFLVHILPKLQKLAQIYATTAVRNRIVREVHPKIRVKMHQERTHWLEFKFEMDGISDKDIRGILAALELKQKYYRLPNGSLLSLEAKEMEVIRKLLAAEPAQDDGYQLTLEKPILESLKFLDFIQDSPVFSPEESFLAFLDQLLHPESLEFEVPKSLESILRDYQKAGFKWMKALAQYGFGGVLADDMGLGKTLQSITFIVSELANIRSRKCPVLIVCPSSLTYNWLNELMTFASEIQAIVMDGNQIERKELRKNLQDIDVLITSYPILCRDFTWFEKQVFHTVFFDEAQAFKNPFTQTARSVKKIQADNRFGLTGTPLENSIEELWSIYHVVFPQLFQGLEAYSHLRTQDIAKRVRPFMLRREKTDVLAELPEKEESLAVSELLPEQKKLYAGFLAKLREETLKHLDKETFDKNKIRILAGLTRLRQICCHPGLFVEGYQGSSAKFQQLFQILEEARRSGRRLLIFSQFTQMLGMIGRELTSRGQAYFYLDGSTPSEERIELCRRFNEGERDLFLISLKAGGTGLNLTGADTVILYDLWWNPAVEEQAADRAHRIGQKHTVQVIKLVARGTIEEKMNELQAKKRKLIADILDADEKTTSTLTEEDIRDILMK
ncbi:DEAD/DEAH box helicase [Caldifermentibacillus hisashii]|uniref:DEAD/DEAH box helicase n=1 Tax=Caldifermentibacillus hisashii TaxID=996558 RepID=UPI0031B6A56B